MVRVKQLKVSLRVVPTDISGRGQFWVIHHLPKQTHTEKPVQVLWLKINLCSPIFLLIFYKCIKGPSANSEKMYPRVATLAVNNLV